MQCSACTGGAGTSRTAYSLDGDAQPDTTADPATRVLSRTAVAHRRLNGDPRLQRAAEHLHALGARPMAEFVAELLDTAGADPCLLDRLLDWRQLNQAVIRALGADRFPLTIGVVSERT